MLIQSQILYRNPTFLLFSSISSSTCLSSKHQNLQFSTPFSDPALDFPISSGRRKSRIKMSLNSVECLASLEFEDEIYRFVQVGNKVVDAAGEVIRKYFQKSFEILDKEDLSPVTIVDRAVEESMISIILENFPFHAIYGEENGWRCKETTAEFVWVLDPIDGTKSFITGKPLFGTLIALLHKGKLILGIIDQPVLKERWIRVRGKRTTYNGGEVSTRSCAKLPQAYLYTTSPLLFSEEAEKAFARVRNKVKVPLYGCDCYAYALVASGFVDLVVESGLKVLMCWQLATNNFTNRL